MKDKYIDIRWYVSDILDYNQDLIDNDILDYKLSDDEALEVLNILEKDHDCNFGITWDIIELAISDFISEKEKTQ